MCGEDFEEEVVAGFGEVVAALVDFVDSALDGGDLGVRGVGQAGLIFRVPEFEVGGVLAGYCEEEGIVLRDGKAFDLMPAAGGVVLQGGDGLGGDGLWLDHSTTQDYMLEL